MRTTQGLIDDGLIEQVHLDPPRVDLSAIPEQHRTRFFNPGELDALAFLLSGKKRIIEIGCQNGRTAKAILSNRPDIELYIGIDVPPGTPAACAVQQTETPQRAGELALDDERFYLMLAKNGSACGILQLMRYHFFDAVFIDGDHSYEAVMRDDENARSLIRRDGYANDVFGKQGVVIHHDYHSLGTVGVREAIQELTKQGVKFKHVAGTWLVYSEV